MGKNKNRAGSIGGVQQVNGRDGQELHRLSTRMVSGVHATLYRLRDPLWWNRSMRRNSIRPLSIDYEDTVSHTSLDTYPGRSIIKAARDIPEVEERICASVALDNMRTEPHVKKFVPDEYRLKPLEELLLPYMSGKTGELESYNTLLNGRAALEGPRIANRGRRCTLSHNASSAWGAVVATLGFLHSNELTTEVPAGFTCCALGTDGCRTEGSIRVYPSHTGSYSRVRIPYENRFMWLFDHNVVRLMLFDVVNEGRHCQSALWWDSAVRRLEHVLEQHNVLDDPAQTLRGSAMKRWLAYFKVLPDMPAMLSAAYDEMLAWKQEEGIPHFASIQSSHARNASLMLRSVWSERFGSLGGAQSSRFASLVLQDQSTAELLLAVHGALVGRTNQLRNRDLKQQRILVDRGISDINIPRWEART